MTNELLKYLEMIKDHFDKSKQIGFSGDMTISLKWNQGGIRNGKIRLEKDIKLKPDT